MILLLFLKNLGGKMPNSIFNLRRHSGDILRFFSYCPGILSLFRHSGEEGYSQIHCKDYEGKEVDLFVPMHQIVIRRCSSSKIDYLFTKVCFNPNTEPKFWLVTCPRQRVGYLFPIATFDDEGEDTPFPQEHAPKKCVAEQ